MITPAIIFLQQTAIIAVIQQMCIRDRNNMDKYRIVVLAFGSGEVDVIDVDKEIVDNVNFTASES